MCPLAEQKVKMAVTQDLKLLNWCMHKTKPVKTQEAEMSSFCFLNAWIDFKCVNVVIKPKHGLYRKMNVN